MLEDKNPGIFREGFVRKFKIGGDVEYVSHADLINEYIKFVEKKDIKFKLGLRDEDNKNLLQEFYHSVMMNELRD